MLQMILQYYQAGYCIVIHCIDELETAAIFRIIFFIAIELLGLSFSEPFCSM